MTDTSKLDARAFANVVKHAPLVSIDLILHDPQGKILLGCRRNPPAKGRWFVPGGRIRKDEQLDEAFRRIFLEELGDDPGSVEVEFAGVFEHFYQNNFASEAGFGTHYVVLAYKVVLDSNLADIPRGQHSDYRWWEIADLLKSPEVHRYTKDYFMDP